MTPANDYQRMNTLKLICLTLIKGWHNHAQRNERLRSIQDLIWEWREEIRREGAERSYHDQTLRACYDLATPWSIGHVQETHSNVKTRLRLIVEICEQELERLAEVAREQRQIRKQFGIVSESDDEPSTNEINQMVNEAYDEFSKGETHSIDTLWEDWGEDNEQE